DATHARDRHQAPGREAALDRRQRRLPPQELGAEAALVAGSGDRMATFAIAMRSPAPPFDPGTDLAEEPPRLRVRLHLPVVEQPKPQGMIDLEGRRVLARVCQRPHA